MHEPVRNPGARPHATGTYAAEGATTADVPAARASDEAASAHSTAAGATATTALRKRGYSQQQGKRRDGYQATHTRTL